MSCLQVSTFYQSMKVLVSIKLIGKLFFFSSKSAVTEGLEIDQYIWAILNNSDTDEVSIDSSANWKAVGPPSSNPGGGMKPSENENDSKKISKVMSPGSTILPTWDNNQDICNDLNMLGK